jgi:hypothetical protein
MARITAERLAPKTKEDLGPKVRAHTRYHLANGEQVPGVTTIVGVLGFNKDVLVKWARNEALAGNDPDKIRDETATIGTLVHDMVECELAGKDFDGSDYSSNQIERALHAWKTFHDWREQHTLDAELVEQQLVSELYGYGGTIDCWGQLDGQPVLLDFKTSGSGIWLEHRVQVSAYWQLLKENDYPVKGVRILRIPRDGAAFQEHIMTRRQVVDGWRMFRHALALYRLHKVMR